MTIGHRQAETQTMVKTIKLWYTPKYRIIEVINKLSRFSLKLELFQQLNTNIFDYLD